MNHSPLVSVIVPNYNHADYLSERIESILNQTYQHFEIIILDDQSTDNSISIIEAYAKQEKISQVIINEKNSGSSIQQWKKGISVAQGDWIWLAESDDFSDPHFLEKMLNFSESNPDCGLLYCQTEDVDASGNVIGNRISYTEKFSENIWKKNFSCESDDFIRTYMKVKNVIPNASAVLFKKKYVTNEVFDELILSLFFAADWLFWIRLSKKTKIGFVAETLNFFRYHSSVTRNHSSKSRIWKRINEEITIRKQLAVWYPEIKQEDEWEIIYSRWFACKFFFPLMSPKFYSPKMPGLSYLAYIKKYRQFIKKQHSTT